MMRGTPLLSLKEHGETVRGRERTVLFPRHPHPLPHLSQLLFSLSRGRNGFAYGVQNIYLLMLIKKLLLPSKNTLVC